MRLAWRRCPPWLARLIVAGLAYAVLAALSGPAARSPGWLKILAGLGAFTVALGFLAASTGAWSRWPAKPVWMGLGQLVLGAAALAGALIGVPAGGYHGRPLFWAWSVGMGGLITVLYGAAAVIYGWTSRPAATARAAAREDDELSAAADRALAVDEQTRDASPAGRRDLAVAGPRPSRIGLAVLMVMFAVAGLALAVLSVLVPVASTPADPQPALPYVLLGLIGAALLVQSAMVALWLVRMRGWLDDTTLTVLRPTGHRSADLATVSQALLRQPWLGFTPVLTLSGGGNLRRLPLRQWGSGKPLPADDLVLLAAALTANPLRSQFVPTIVGLRDLAGFPSAVEQHPQQHAGQTDPAGQSGRPRRPG